MNESNLKTLFFQFYNASTEDEVDKIINSNPELFKNQNWFPLGDNDSNYGVVENQQSNSVASLIEKIINSIDAILTKKCLESGIDPKSSLAPKSMKEAIEKLFPDSKNWDLPTFRQKQAESIQIHADGPRLTPSLTIYDEGEGQDPEVFDKTFLSLLRGNKNDIKFVQGKYNMGGSGAMVFCGKKRYQLIASKRYDNSGNFGFTITREHPLTDLERDNIKNTWYEYLTIEGKIPSFNIDELDLGLYNRKFKTGTIIKLYSYHLPPNSRSVISRDLNLSINEYLFEPALPIYTIDTKERYPNDRNLERDLYGLKRRLERDDSKYIEEYFSEEYNDQLFGNSKVTCYVFNTRVDGRSAKETKDTISREFFKNNMSVLFSINGQVHGFYTYEFITRSLKMNLLKNHLLIHVDCTNMKYEFRKELFMASRDRLKGGEESTQLRDFLSSKLRKSKLADIEKRRKEAISFESENTKDLLKSFSKNLPLNPEMLKLLNQTFKLDQQDDKQKKDDNKKKKKPEKIEQPFKPNRFPSYFKLQGKEDDENYDKEIAKIPLDGEKTIKFHTDVEDQYFDRVEDPGQLKIALLNIRENNVDGGTGPGTPKEIEEVFNVNIASPDKGTIRVTLNPKSDINIGDAYQLKVSLTSPAEDFDQIFFVKISDKEKPKEKSKEKDDSKNDNIGLPEFVLVYKESDNGFLTWDAIEANGISMDYETVMFPMVTGENLEKIYINMDSNVLKNFKSKYKNPDVNQLELADRKYWTSVYFHTLFLFSITKNRNYSIYRMLDGDEKDVDIGEYLEDLFKSYYSEFILNFGGTHEMMEGLGD